MELFIVGKVNLDNYLEWEFAGIFDSLDKADRVCLDESFFIGKATLNEVLKGDNHEWPEAFYPRSEDDN